MENKFKKIIENIAAGIWIMNFEEEFIYANPAASYMFEVPQEQLLGRKLKDFVSDSEWLKILKQTEQRKGGKSGKYNLKIKTGKGNPRVLSVTANAEYDKKNIAVNSFGVFYDITESVLEKRKLIEMNQQFEELHQQLFTQTLEADIQKEKKEKYSKYLDDGINYAKTIQRTLLPSLEEINEILPQVDFIFYKPKHIIGGDFYYINEKNDYKIFSVADCTGHGVSGALISMLGITFLNDIIDRNLLVNSSEILGKLRDKVKKAFKSHGKSLENKNGMDITFCIINKKTNTLQFSGANNPLWIIRDKKLLEYKPTRNPIGFYPVEKEFETHHIQLKKDDYIYLFSDGFHDQMGGEIDRKYSKKRFRELLLEIHLLDGNTQKARFESELKNWKAKSEQVDDITIMGVKWGM